LENPTVVPKYITKIHVGSFKNPFHKLAWLFTKLTSQEIIATISLMIPYILYFTIKEKAILDWGKVISIEITSQLSHYKRDNKFFMDSYLLFAIICCC